MTEFYVHMVCFLYALLWSTTNAFPNIPLHQFPLEVFNEGQLAAIARSGDRKPQDLGIGFDLSGSYGTVSIAYSNDSIVDIAKIEGNRAYKNLLAHWSLESSQHPAPPYTGDKGDSWKDRHRQKLRADRKAQGLPASDDVETLSVMLKALQVAAESYLGHKISSALASTPDLIALYQEDLYDTFDYIQLENLDNENTLFHMYHQAGAVVASHGLGLCKNYTDAAGCKKEYRDMPFRYILTVLYTTNSLCVELSVFASAYFTRPYQYSPSAMDFTLGSDMKHNNPGEEHYWEAVRDNIHRGLLTGLRLNRKPEMVFVFGESSHNDTFRAVLKDSLKDILGGVPEMIYDNPIFRTARGSAILAMRGGY